MKARPYLRILTSAMIVLPALVACASPTAEITATNTPTIAAATATPVSATATAAPPTKTPTPTSIPVTFEIISGAGNPAQNTAYQQLLAARLQITESVTCAAYRVGDVESLVLLAGEPRDKLTGATIQPLTRLLVAENDLITWGYPELAALTAAGGTPNVILARLAGTTLTIEGLVAYTNGEHYVIIEKDNGATVLKNYLNKDNPDAPEYLLEIDPNNPERLVTYINDSPIYIPTNWQEPMSIAEASDLFINPFEGLKAECVIGNDIEFTELPAYITVPNGWQFFKFNGTLNTRKIIKIYSNGIVAFGPKGEVLVFNNDIDWDNVANPGIGYAISFKTDENGNPLADPFNNNLPTLRAVFLGDPNEPALIWNVEGGEDGNGAWEEEAKEYASAAEALLAVGTIEIFEMPLGTGQDAPTLTSYADNSWKKYEEYTDIVAGAVKDPDNIEPGLIENTMREFLLNKWAENGGVAAINIETGEPEIVKVDENVDIVTISALGEKNSTHLQLPPNADGVTQLWLPGYMQISGPKGIEFGIWYIPATATSKAKIVVYYETNYQMYLANKTSEEQKLATIPNDMISPLALLTIPPTEMIEKILSTPEGNKRLTCSQVIIDNEVWKLGSILVELTDSIGIWQMADNP